MHNQTILSILHTTLLTIPQGRRKTTAIGVEYIEAVLEACQHLKFGSLLKMIGGETLLNSELKKSR